MCSFPLVRISSKRNKNMYINRKTVMMNFSVFINIEILHAPLLNFIKERIIDYDILSDKFPKFFMRHF